MSGPSDRPARPWSAVHDNGRIPVGFRLHLTATPRILAAAWPQKCKDGRELEIASMPSDPACPPCEWIYHLEPSETIDREILAGFEIDVLEIRGPSPVLGLSEEGLWAAAQVVQPAGRLRRREPSLIGPRRRFRRPG